MLQNNLHIIPPVIAHRGASANAPENTLAAFAKAKQLGAKWVEFDVMLAQCGEVVVIHDETIDRTTDGVGEVSQYPYSYLKTLDAGKWFNPVFSGEKIPTLTMVIHLLHTLQLSANIEIKALPGMEKMTVQKVLQVLQDCWTKDMPQPLISSFSRVALRAVKKYSPQHLLGFLMHEWQADWKEICDELQCASVNVSQDILNKKRVQEVKLTDRLVLAYVINDAARARELFSWGVDAVFTDDLNSVFPDINPLVQA